MDELLFDNRIADLIKKYLQDKITEVEQQELHAWVVSSTRAREVFDELTSEEKLPGELTHFSESRKRILDKIRDAEPETRVAVEINKGFRWRPWLAAAVVVGLAIASYIALINNKTAEQPAIVEQKPVRNDIAPGKDGAILTLADGKKIDLDDLKEGESVQQGNTTITKKDGKLVYSVATTGKTAIEYNIMTTPKGRTYRAVLSDGSVVWLNAASSIHYPVVFAGNERKVEITGEAYFEVAKNAIKPFIVVAKGVSTEVLGTSFNVNSYDDEADIRVTLLEGSVKVNKETGESKTLKPGQQAAISSKSQSIPVEMVDVDQVIAWKNGLFQFHSTPMHEMMRQIARWYDVEVVYEGEIKNDPITGTMERNTNASEALAILGYMGYKFRIDGKKITVIP